MRTSDGAEVGSILIDKRLAFAHDVQSYIDMAKATGRSLNVYDVDAPLHVSLAGVLERQPDGPDPLPPFHIVASGFEAVRSNRKAIVEMFVADPSLGVYELYGTTPDGSKVKVAEVVNGELTIYDEAMYLDITAAPSEAADVFGNQVITAESIGEITAALSAQRAEKVRSVLEPYIGRTWKEALDAHSASR
jgi:hypothetical protein